MNLKILITCFSMLVLCSCRSNGVGPHQKIKNLPYFMTQLITFRPDAFGPKITQFDSSQQVYNLDFGLERQIKNIVNQNVITSGFSSNSNGSLAYRIKSEIKEEGTTGSLELRVLGKSSISKITLNMIVISGNLLMVYTYLTLFQKQVSSQSKEYINMMDIDNYEFYPLVKSVVIQSVISENSQGQSIGFRTLGEKKAQESSGKLYEFSFQKDNTLFEYNISVTYVIIAANPTLFKQTAQFSSLHLAILWQSTHTDSVYLIPQDYSNSYKSNTIFGYSEWTGFKSNSPSIEFSLEQDMGIKFASNFINKQFKYSVLELVDYRCPNSHPFKFKSDPLCYRCQKQSIMEPNSETVFNEYRSLISDYKCNKINVSASGYNFGENGQIISVCAVCRDPKQLEVEDSEENSEANVEEADTKASLKQRVIENLSKLYNQIVEKIQLKAEISSLTVEEKKKSHGEKNEQLVERIK